MNIVRETVKDRLLGESIAKLTDGDGLEIETPTPAANLQEVYQKEEFNGIYKLGVALPNQIFNMNPFYDTRNFSSGNKAIEMGIENYNRWLKLSQADMSFFAPKYSTELDDIGRQRKFTREVSAGSNATFLTIPEASSLNSTKRLMDGGIAELKKEGIEKKVLLQINMNQDELDFNLKCTLASTKGSGYIIDWENARDRWQNLIRITKDCNTKTIRILNNVPRDYQSRSAILPTTALIADVVSHATLRGGSSKKDKKQRTLMTDAQRKKIEINRALRFRISDDGLYRYADFKKYGITALECGCEADQQAGDTIEDFIREYNNHPYYATNVHNVAAIYETIARMRWNIGGGLKKFFGGMENSRRVLEDVYHQHPWQNAL